MYASVNRGESKRVAMQDFFDPHVRELDPALLLLIVVGARLEAELTDRALGYRLREQILRWQERAEGPVSLRPVLCTDLWYLNTQALRLRPTIALGSPDDNAATAYLAARIPTALIVEDCYRIQLDPELIDLNACLWGTSPETTATALDCFSQRYLPQYLAMAHRMAGG